MLKGRLNANHVRIGFRVHQTGKAVARRATDAFALLRILLVQENADRQVKWLVAEFLQIVTQLLDPQLMADRWKSIGFAGGGVCPGFTTGTVGPVTEIPPR